MTIVLVMNLNFAWGSSSAPPPSYSEPPVAWTMQNRIPDWTMSNRLPDWTMPDRLPDWTEPNRNEH